MAIKATSIRDVFKQKVIDSTKPNLPTIWVDLDGNEHVDTDYFIIGAYPNGDPVVTRIYTSEEPLVYNDFHSDITYSSMTVPGTIIQVGSHVKQVSRISMEDRTFTPNELKHLFMGAYNLECAISCFTGNHSLPEIPGDLFRNCKNLKYAGFLFEDSNISKIPEDLFSYSPSLEEINGCFHDCLNITSIPEGLFRNNPKLKSVAICFQDCTNLIEIPSDLFKDNPDIDDLTNTFTAIGVRKIPETLFDSIKRPDHPVELLLAFRDCKDLIDVPLGFFKDFPDGSNLNGVLGDTAFQDKFISKSLKLEDYFPDWAIKSQNVIYR